MSSSNSVPPAPGNRCAHRSALAGDPTRLRISLRSRRDHDSESHSYSAHPSSHVRHPTVRRVARRMLASPEPHAAARSSRPLALSVGDSLQDLGTCSLNQLWRGVIKIPDDRVIEDLLALGRRHFVELCGGPDLLLDEKTLSKPCDSLDRTDDHAGHRAKSRSASRPKMRRASRTPEPIAPSTNPACSRYVASPANKTRPATGSASCS